MPYVTISRVKRLVNIKEIDNTFNESLTISIARASELGELWINPHISTLSPSLTPFVWIFNTIPPDTFPVSFGNMVALLAADEHRRRWKITALAERRFREEAEDIRDLIIKLYWTKGKIVYSIRDTVVGE